MSSEKLQRSATCSSQRHSQTGEVGDALPWEEEETSVKSDPASS